MNNGQLNDLLFGYDCKTEQCVTWWMNDCMDNFLMPLIEAGDWDISSGGWKGSPPSGLVVQTFSSLPGLTKNHIKQKTDKSILNI